MMMMMSFEEILKMVEKATLNTKRMYWQDEILDAATKIYMKQMELSNKEIEKEIKRNKMYDEIIASIDAGRRKWGWCRMTRKETIEMLKILKEQALSSCNDTVIIDVKKDSFIFVINMAIKLLEQETILDKIRAKIEELHLIGYATVDGKREIASRAVMQIIDKYKAESEEK